MDNINQKILYHYISLNDIIEIIYTYKFTEINSEKIIYDDKYNFYNKIDEKIKIYINYDDLEKQNNNTKKKAIKNTINIPNELLLNNKQIYKLIINEIKKVNTNFLYDHYILPLNNNIFELQIILKIKKLEIKLKIVLNDELYPFLPPTLEIISPVVKIELYNAISNLNVLKLNNWCLTYSLEWLIINLAEKLEKIEEYIEDNIEYSNIQLHLLKLSNLTNEINNKINIDFELNKDKTINSNQKTYWKLGTGYGYGNNNTTWDIKNYIKEKEFKNLEIVKILLALNNDLNEENIEMINNSILLNYIINLSNGINLLQIETDNLIFTEIIKILLKIRYSSKLKKIINDDFITKLINNLKIIDSEILILFEQNDNSQNNELYQSIHNIYQIYNELHIDNLILLPTENAINDESENYCNVMKPLQFKMTELISNYRFNSNKSVKLDQKSLKRVISEISSFKTGLPLNYDSTIWVRVAKNNMNCITFLISGPKDTPYENGLFEFHAFIPDGYPNKVPEVLFNTTGQGDRKFRFNPNLYDTGKVCLSLLGTWNSGNLSEKWNSETSSFLQILVSIQSLILVEEPYFNEPGYEAQINTPQGKNSCIQYNNNIYAQTINLAMINQIKNPIPEFEDVIKNHFKLKKNQIINQVDNWMSKYTPTKSPLKLDEQIVLLKEALSLL
jgi:ubiquitin-protein ligase